MIYTVTLNPSLDYIVRMDKLTPGEINRADYEQIKAGGKGINVSIVLHNLGHDSVALGFVAGFTGDEIRREMHSRNIYTDFCAFGAWVFAYQCEDEGGRGDGDQWARSRYRSDGAGGSDAPPESR